MRIISDPAEGITATIQFPTFSTDNSIAETGDVLATGSSQIITGTSSALCLDKTSNRSFLVTPGQDFFIGGRWKSRNVSKVWASSGTTANHRIYEWQDNTQATIGYLRVNPTTNVLEVYGPSGLLASSSASVTNLTNYHIELRVFIDPIIGAINVKLNGTSIIGFTGDTGTNAVNYILQRGPGIAIGDVDATLGHWFDDFYINNTSNADGKGDTGFAGQIRMVIQLPTGDGNYISFTPSPGSNANYQNVNSLSNITNNNFSSNPGLLDSFPVGASGLSGITITACTTRTLAQSTNTPQLISLGVRQSSNDFIDPSQSVPITSQLFYDSRNVLNPDTALQWTISEANSNEVIYQHAAI